MSYSNKSQPSSTKIKLLDQVRQAIRVRHYSLQTEKAYVHWIKRFVLFHKKRHPQEMGTTEIGSFLSHLAVKEHVAASTQNQALCALLFLYKEVLHQELGQIEGLVWASLGKEKLGFGNYHIERWWNWGCEIGSCEVSNIRNLVLLEKTFYI
jgi:hypothetical protein